MGMFLTNKGVKPPQSAIPRAVGKSGRRRRVLRAPVVVVLHSDHRCFTLYSSRRHFTAANIILFLQNATVSVKKVHEFVNFVQFRLNDLAQMSKRELDERSGTAPRP